jgi:NADH-quinone oxidoreductase subunit L
MSEFLAISNQYLLWVSFVVIGMPFVSFISALLFRKIAALISISSIFISLFASVILFLGVWDKETIQFSLDWINFSSFNINVGFLLNDLTVLMLVLVSFIALLVNFYSVEYMKTDQLKPRYFAYLSLFCFAMLGLVLANNLLLVYIFWELVGFSSYLLIGFWFTREKAVQANKKAFIINRIGDLGFLFGLMILLTQFKTLDIDTLFGSGKLIVSSSVIDGLWVTPFGSMSAVWLTVSGLCFFAGAIAKSAQFPLHTWLPDAMEGPTAVSSLIHAATMVAAGVFLLVRIEPLFNDTVLFIIALVGLFTAFMAATIAVTQNDIKGVLAFSTISQLGFMMLAIGVGDSAAAILHLVTHAFFKCLLFLGAGIIIHELHHLKEKCQLNFDPQDLRNMGGLRKMLPITSIVFLMASLALAGLPFTSGYLSKDAILISVFEWADLQGGVYWVFPIIVSITSWLTAFYIFRVVFKVFFGEFRLPRFLNVQVNSNSIHEPHSWMKYPVMILALFCLGFVFSLNPFSLESSWLHQQLIIKTSNDNLYHILVPILINVLSIILIYGTYQIYTKKQWVLTLESKWFYKFSYHQWYFNELYDKVFVKTVLWKSKVMYWFDVKVVDGTVNFVGSLGIYVSKIADWFDRTIIDGLVNGLGKIVAKFSEWFKSVQNGKVQHYLIWMFLVFLSFFIFQMIF